jgi:hypothetical protein
MLLGLVRPLKCSSRVLALVSILTGVALSGCGGAPPPAELVASGGAAGDWDADGGATSHGADYADGATDAVPSAAPSFGAGPAAPPGIYLTSETATSSGVSPCATTTLGSVLAAIRAGHPALADIQTLYDPTTSSADGSYISAYDVGTLGFDIVFKRGLGDCAAGCTENDYQYFSTEGSCRPVQVGHYHAAWGTGTCLTVEGTPMWTHPLPPDPLTVCGEDNSPQDLRGTYTLHASGQRATCAPAAATSSSGGTIQVVIVQDAKDLGTGSVTFSLTGDPLVDGVALPARFQRRRFDAAVMSSSSPGSCARASTVTARYDFEGYQPGGIDALDYADPICGTCKGSLNVVLAGAARLP